MIGAAAELVVLGVGAEHGGQEDTRAGALWMLLRRLWHRTESSLKNHGGRPPSDRGRGTLTTPAGMEE
ncbi:MAG: hypothetical protein M0C28_13365 [Candidatus Moduliflexus flocculans]|nr:hypothetical protein [Candidatus Moduliflexus flocculans]